MNRMLILPSSLLFAGALGCGGSDAATGPNNHGTGASTALPLQIRAVGLLWTAQTQEPVNGSIRVHLTSVSLGSDGRTYSVHGTADGTLTPDQSSAGATGTVTVHVVF
jgi:hypothetical protein